MFVTLNVSSNYDTCSPSHPSSFYLIKLPRPLSSLCDAHSPPSLSSHHHQFSIIIADLLIQYHPRPQPATTTIRQFRLQHFSALHQPHIPRRRSEISLTAPLEVPIRVRQAPIQANRAQLARPVDLAAQRNQIIVTIKSNLRRTPREVPRISGRLMRRAGLRQPVIRI